MRYSFRATPLQFLMYVVVSSVVLTIILQTFTGIRVDEPTSALIAVILIQVIQGFAQPLFSIVAKVLGVLGILLVSIFGYAIVIWAALEIVPGIANVDFGGSLVAAWVYAIVVTLLQWVILAQSDEYFLHQVVRAARKKQKNTTTVPGFVFVQLDGVSAPVLEWQLQTGNLPNIKRLIDSDSYTLRRWHTQIPSTTPASQAGILHGSHDGIPAFRWYERDRDTLMVANQPAGAALIEKRLSDGKGLLADGGVSIGNLFSGDAVRNIMVMSKLDGDRQTIRTMREYTSYFSNLYGFMRAFVLSIGEMIKEVYQAQRQRLRDVQPRVNRKPSYIVLRAATNVILRDLQTTIVVDQMIQGTNSIYVDYLDYDEIAHHAGIARPESLAALSGLDHIVGIITKAQEYTPRPYNVVFVSDHGQSQGPTFKQLNDGKGLESVLGNLLGTSAIQAETAPIEQESIARSLYAQGATGSGISGSTARKLRDQYRKKTDEDNAGTPQHEIVVTGSGNLGNVWFKDFKSRPTRQKIDAAYPGFLKHLLNTNGIGLLIVLGKNRQPICIGQDGEVNLKTGEVTGSNPLSAYKTIRLQDLLQVGLNSNAPDLQIISSRHPSTGEVYAFEELVGNHGGIGGWQTEAILLHPSSLSIPERFLDHGELYDSATVHKVFTNWLEQAGQRNKLLKSTPRTHQSHK